MIYCTMMQDNAKTNASEEARLRINARERAKRASETEATHLRTSLATIVLNGAHPSVLKHSIKINNG